MKFFNDIRRVKLIYLAESCYGSVGPLKKYRSYWSIDIIFPDPDANTIMCHMWQTS